MVELHITPKEDIQKAYDIVKSTFINGKTRPIAWRKHQIKRLGFMIQENEPAFLSALAQDLGRSSFETTVAELNGTKYEINEAYDELEKWAKPVKVKTSAAWALAKATVTPDPKGTVLVIGTWNYPISLTMVPLLGAISAGCTALLKPAEQCPAVANLIASLMPRYLDPSAFKVINGAVEETTALLKLRFEHIFYTGSGNVGRIIARAAAEHLTPCTLELGGKSACVVSDDANMLVAARRIMWGKFVNSGQTCISPDYILCTPATQTRLIDAFRAIQKEFKPSAGSLTDDKSYAKIVSGNHFKRLGDLLERTKGRVVLGGGKNEGTGKIEVTIVADCKGDDSLMEGEIFGPILPIVPVPNIHRAAIDFINARDQPLALYVFSNSTKTKDQIFRNCRSGSFVQNDVMIQFAVPGLPFGGTGPSGYGNYHGKRSFDTFSHERPSAVVPFWMDTLLASRYPPYTPQKLKMLLFATGATIKKPITRLGRLQGLLKLFAVLFAVRTAYGRFAGPSGP